MNGYRKDILDVSLDDIKTHLDDILTQGNIKFSFVGDVRESQTMKFISNTLSSIPESAHEQNSARSIKSNNDLLSKTLKINHDSNLKLGMESKRCQKDFQSGPNAFPRNSASSGFFAINIRAYVSWKGRWKGA